MRTMSQARADAVRAVKRLYHVLRRAMGGVVDRLLNVDTARLADLSELGVEAPNRVHYDAGGWLDLFRALRPGEVGPNDVFLDLGCGKGRMVLLASRRPFRRVIGVDISEHLIAIARRNLASFRLRPRCDDVSLVTADALEYEIPPDVSVVYLNNPFREEIFDAVLARLKASVDRHPRPVRLIYRTAIHHDRLLRDGRFRHVRSIPGVRPTRAWRERTAMRLYMLEPPGAAA
jgi:SAM-dependent methyltransferase